MTPPRGLRAAHRERTLATLVDTALRLFAERGFAAVTVEEICAAAEVSPRTFFRYFPTKEHVLAAPVTAVLDTLGDALAGQPDDVPAWTALERALTEAVDRVEERAESFLRVSRVLRADPAALAANAEVLMSWEQRMHSEVGRRLGDGPESLRPRLLLGTAMLAFRVALDRWADEDGAVPAGTVLAAALTALTPGAHALQDGAGGPPREGPGPPRS